MTSLLEFLDSIPDEAAAEAMIGRAVWGPVRACGHCGSTDTREAPGHRPMHYWCSDCGRYFSVRTGTALAHSKVPLRKWAIAFYLEATSPKGISSIALGRAIGVRQATAWFMLHRIREGWPALHEERDRFVGPVEMDETYVGGLERNKHADKKLNAGRGERWEGHRRRDAGSRDEPGPGAGRRIGRSVYGPDDVRHLGPVRGRPIHG